MSETLKEKFYRECTHKGVGGVLLTTPYDEIWSWIEAEMKSEKEIVKLKAKKTLLDDMLEGVIQGYGDGNTKNEIKNFIENKINELNSK